MPAMTHESMDALATALGLNTWNDALPATTGLWQCWADRVREIEMFGERMAPDDLEALRYEANAYSGHPVTAPLPAHAH